jgi:hypothetical protein
MEEKMLAPRKAKNTGFLLQSDRTDPSNQTALPFGAFTLRVLILNL